MEVYYLILKIFLSRSIDGSWQIFSNFANVEQLVGPMVAIHVFGKNYERHLERETCLFKEGGFFLIHISSSFCIQRMIKDSFSKNVEVASQKCYEIKIK